jgi:uncharacterized RDD family membrane protein YckC
MAVVLGGAMVFSAGFHDPTSIAYGLGMAFSIVLFSTLVNWLYYTLMESSTQQATLRKLALGMVVIGECGGRISFAREWALPYQKNHCDKWASHLFMAVETCD